MTHNQERKPYLKSHKSFSPTWLALGQLLYDQSRIKGLHKRRLILFNLLFAIISVFLLLIMVLPISKFLILAEVCMSYMSRFLEGSSFMLGRALTFIPWGMIADRYGRKPVIVIGAITVFPYLLPCLMISLFGFVATVMSLWLPETLHKHKKGNKDQSDPHDVAEGTTNGLHLSESMTHSESKIPNSQKNLLKNWPLVSAIIVYCVFQLHDMAYLERIILYVGVINGHSGDELRRRFVSLPAVCLPIGGKDFWACHGFSSWRSFKHTIAGKLPVYSSVIQFLSVHSS
ncbi:hypothetical protein CQW23_32840 [Capsicum baccatum]|uniref:Major facilitator superfamily (MFS) profile domain-containing protein n=1 Tax=Capsicum baccatum TaxID=33114 RepID=A0A2G2V3J9_CAPBA|nr:hypothetical protein CQW23_32840 [Capsicum baccatum]